MPNLGEALSELKSLPDDALQRELASPTGMLPGYLVLGEMHERKNLRAGKGPTKARPQSLADEYIGDIRQRMPMPPQQSAPLPPPRSPAQMVMPPPAPGGGGISSLSASPPQGYARGGIVSQSNWEQPHGMTARPELVQDPDWDWVQREMIGSRARRQNIPFPDEGPIPPWRDDMDLEDLRFLSAPERNEYANGGVVGLAKGGQVGKIEAYIRAAAARIGVDPDIAVAVARSEGGLDNITRQSEVYKNGVREESYGPFQLYMRGGLGNRALAAGIDPRTEEGGWKGIDFALAEAKNKGWGQWYGWKGDKWAGIKDSGGASYPSGDTEVAAVDTVDTETPATPTDTKTTGSLGGGSSYQDYMTISKAFGLDDKPQAPEKLPVYQVQAEPFDPSQFFQDPQFFRRRYG